MELVERPRITRISWGGVFAGLFSAFGIWLLLVLIGDAIGLSSVKGNNGQSWLDLLKGLGLWLGIAAIIAAFCGSWIAARLSASWQGLTGILHGVTLWGFASLLVAYGTVKVVSGVVQTAGNVAGAATSAAGSVLGKTASQLPNALNSDALTQQVNQYLASKNLPRVSPDQLKGTINDLAQQAVAQGGLSQQQVSQIVSRNTDLSHDQVDAISNQLSDKLRDVGGQAKQTLSGVGQQASNVAQQVGTGAQQVSAKTMWGLFIMSLLSLGAAIAGGALGALAFRRGETKTIERPIERPNTPLKPREA
jgi:hypothetical protein